MVIYESLIFIIYVMLSKNLQKRGCFLILNICEFLEIPLFWGVFKRLLKKRRERIILLPNLL